MKKYVTIIFILLSIQSAYSQERESAFSIDLGADIVSRYIWRGINLSESPAIQPTIGLTYNDLTFGSWGSFTVARETIQEVDLFLTYEKQYFSITINNYYNTLDTLGFSGNYFQLSGSSTPHALEGVIAVNGPESLPLSLSAATMFWGNDRDEDGTNLFSTYIELSYPFTANEIETSAFIGITPANGYYHDKFGVVNLGFSMVKEIRITDNFSLPLMGSFMVNPVQEKVFLVFGVTL